MGVMVGSGTEVEQGPLDTGEVVLVFWRKGREGGRLLLAIVIPLEESR